MQTLSSMQRNRSNFYIIIDLLFALSFVIYLVTSALFQFLPPLLGLFFLHIVVLNFEKDAKFKKNSFSFYFSIFYLFFCEQVHGFELFSVLLTYIIFYYFCFEISAKLIKFRNALIILSVFIGYFGTFLMSNFISYIKKSQYLNFGEEYMFYIVFEAILGFILFRGRLT